MGQLAYIHTYIVTCLWCSISPSGSHLILRFTQRGSSSSAAGLSAEISSGERSVGVFAGSSRAAQSDLDEPSPAGLTLPLLSRSLRSVKLGEKLGSLRFLQPERVRSDGDADQTVLEEAGA